LKPLRVNGSITALATAVLVVVGGSTASTALGAQTMDQMNYLFLMVNELEHARGLAERPVVLNAEGWYGGDYNRLWMKLEGDASTRESEGEVEGQFLFSRLVAPYWDLQAGVRVDHAWGGGAQTRPHLAVGLQGLAPYWFEVETSLFLDVDGNVSAAFSVAYDMLLSQSLILEPELEVGVAVQDVPEWGIASGVHDLEFGARLRYEVVREFAPYVGYAWHRSFGDTAALLRASGAPYREGSLVFGVRAWY
jgi:copper resistance protein B